MELSRSGRVTAIHGGGSDERYLYDTSGNILSARWSDSTDTNLQGDREYTGTLIRRAGGVRYDYDTEGIKNNETTFTEF